VRRSIARLSLPFRDPFVTASGVATAHSGFIVKLAARYKLPAVYAYRHIVVDGGLILADGSPSV